MAGHIAPLQVAALKDRPSFDPLPFARDTGDRAEKRGLAGPVAAGNGQALSLTDVEGQTLYCDLP